MPSRLSGAAAGKLLEGRPRKLSLARMLAFSGGPFDSLSWPEANLHTSAERAGEAGLDAIIASGTQSEGILLELMVSLFGSDWHRSGVVDAKITRSVFIDDTIQAKARVTARNPVHDGERITLEVWCENGNGEAVIVGEARGVIRHAGRSHSGRRNAAKTRQS